MDVEQAVANRARKLEVSLGDGYWHPGVFMDLRAGDVFRFVTGEARDHKWEYRVNGTPFDTDGSIIGVSSGLVRKRWSWKRSWWLVQRWRTHRLATIKKGLTEQAREWWKHLRPFGKRDFWKRQRRSDKAKLREEP